MDRHAVLKESTTMTVSKTWSELLQKEAAGKQYSVFEQKKLLEFIRSSEVRAEKVMNKISPLALLKYASTSAKRGSAIFSIEVPIHLLATGAFLEFRSKILSEGLVLGIGITEKTLRKKTIYLTFTPAEIVKIKPSRKV